MFRSLLRHRALLPTSSFRRISTSSSHLKCNNPIFLIHQQHVSPLGHLTNNRNVYSSLTTFAIQGNSTSRSSWSSSSTSSHESTSTSEDEDEEEDNLQMLASRFLSLSNPPRLTFLLGGPGSGKGTLASKLPTTHISVGALLRTACTSGSAQSRAISAIMSRGGVVPSELSTRVLLSHLLTLESGCEVLVDGFPRSFDNAVLFNSLGLQAKVVIAIEVGDDVMRMRLRERGRRDDVDNIVEKRLIQFRNEWESIKEFYKRRQLLVVINGEGSAEVVLQRYFDAMKEFESGRHRSTR